MPPIRTCHTLDVSQIFGLIESSSGIGFSGGASQQQAFEDAIMPELLEFASMRDRIRQLALTLKGTAPYCLYIHWLKMDADKALLTACDQVRDDDLPSLGVRLEDKETGLRCTASLPLFRSRVLLLTPIESMVCVSHHLCRRGCGQAG